MSDRARIDCEIDADPQAPLCPGCRSPLQRLNAYSHAWVCEHPSAHGLAHGDAILFYSWEIPNNFSPEERAFLEMVVDTRTREVMRRG